MESNRKWLIATPLILALLALCLCMGAIGVFTLRRLGPLGSFMRSFQVRDTLAESEETQSFSVGETARLVIDNPCGNVEVRGEGQGEIAVTMHKQAWGANDEDARALLDGLQIKLAHEGDTLRISIPDPDRACRDLTGLGHAPRVNFAITTPPQTAVQAGALMGNVSLEAVELDAELNTQFGDIHARDLAGGLRATTQTGRIEASQVHAGSRLTYLESSFGRIHLEEASAGSLEVNSENGQVELSAVTVSGSSLVKSSFGDMSWQTGESRSLEFQSQNGKITLQDLRVAQEVKATTDFGDIRMTGVEGQSYTLKTLNGRIEVNGAAGKVKAQSDFGDIRITDAEGVDFDLRSQNGQIEFQGTLGGGPHQARTDFGNIHLQIPADTAFDFDLQTNFGKISVGEENQSGVDIRLQMPPDEKHWQGAANGGGGLITASSQNGNITVELRPVNQ